MDKKSVFTIDYPVQLFDLAPDAGLRSYTVFNYLQDAAGRHADELGFGLRQLRDSDLSWVLSRIRVRMDEFPEYGDVLRVTTYPSGFDRLFAYRQFRLESALTGRFFGVAGSAWLTLNPENFRPVSPAKYLQGLDHWVHDGEIFFQGETLGKIRNDAETGLPLIHRVSAAQIDYNRHLNNAYYAMFTEDWLGEKMQSLLRMRELQINFNQTTPFRENLLCSGILNEDGSFFVTGTQQSNGKNAFQAQGVCTPVDIA